MRRLKFVKERFDQLSLKPFRFQFFVQLRAGFRRICQLVIDNGFRPRVWVCFFSTCLSARGAPTGPGDFLVFFGCDTPNERLLFGGEGIV